MPKIVYSSAPANVDTSYCGLPAFDSIAEDNPVASEWFFPLLILLSAADIPRIAYAGKIFGIGLAKANSYRL